MIEFIKKNKILFGLTLFIIAMLYVFFPVLGKYTGLHAPDAMSFFSYRYRTVSAVNMLGGAPFTPYTLYSLLINPLYAHELTFIIDTFILTAGAVYYLKGRGVSATAAWCGGLALGLSGYTFTLFCAGHRGYFHMISSAIWAFGLLDRGFKTKQLFYFAMLGIVFAWGIVYQPDVFLLVAAVAGTYALWLSFVSTSGIKKSISQIWPHFLISAVFLFLAGFSGIHTALTTQVANRKAQISTASGLSKNEAGTASKNQAEVAQQKKAQWLFATNWSLPPEDMLEFIVPGIFGNESMYGSHPYWGRLGQPDTSVFQKGRMMPNYRQHTVYLGVLSVLFALFSVCVWLKIRRAEPKNDEESAEIDVYRDIPFWMGILILCLVLAMGRFTPLYRIFYAIPYMNLIRAPVKFLHLVEIATALLCGYGVHAFLSRGRAASQLRICLIGVACVVVGLLTITALIFMTGQQTLIHHVKSLVMIPGAENVSAYALKNIGRSLLFLVPFTTVAFLLSRKNNKRGLIATGYLIMGLLVCDQALIARRYVKSIDLRPYYRENAVLKTLKEDSNGSMPLLVNYNPSQEQDSDWFRRSLIYNGVAIIEPAKSAVGQRIAELFSLLRENPTHLWEVLNVRYLIVPYRAASGLVQAEVAKPLLAFEIGGDGFIRRSVQPEENTLALLKLNNASSGLRLLTSWQGEVAPEEQISRTVVTKQVVSNAADPVGSPRQQDAKIEVLSEQGIPSAHSIRVNTSSSSPVLAVFNQQVSPQHQIKVDGKIVKSYVADGIWMAAEIPAGKHKVILKRSVNPIPVMFALLSILVAIGWGAFRMMKKQHERKF